MLVVRRTRLCKGWLCSLRLPFSGHRCVSFLPLPYGRHNVRLAAMVALSCLCAIYIVKNFLPITIGHVPILVCIFRIGNIGSFSFVFGVSQALMAVFGAC